MKLIFANGLNQAVCSSLKSVTWLAWLGGSCASRTSTRFISWQRHDVNVAAAVAKPSLATCSPENSPVVLASVSWSWHLTMNIEIYPAEQSHGLFPCGRHHLTIGQHTGTSQVQWNNRMSGAEAARNSNEGKSWAVLCVGVVWASFGSIMCSNPPTVICMWYRVGGFWKIYLHVIKSRNRKLWEGISANA